MPSRSFLQAGSAAVSDYELLELVLFRALHRRDVKPFAKDLIARFGSFAEVVSAPRAPRRDQGIGRSRHHRAQGVEAVTHRLARGQVQERTVLSSWSSVLDYCRTAMAFADREQFRVLFLDKRNRLIADEMQQKGTVDHTRSIRAKSSSARSSSAPPPSSWCTTIPPAIRPPRAPTSR